jgi:nucleoside-diphosphate-sugar epimerase
MDHSTPNQPHEIIVPKVVYNMRTSYVYVRDVAVVVQRLLRGDIKNEIFNIGMVKKYDHYYFFQYLSVLF